MSYCIKSAFTSKPEGLTAKLSLSQGHSLYRFQKYNVYYSDKEKCVQIHNL